MALQFTVFGELCPLVLSDLLMMSFMPCLWFLGCCHPDLLIGFKEGVNTYEVDHFRFSPTTCLGLIKELFKVIQTNLPSTKFEIQRLHIWYCLYKYPKLWSPVPRLYIMMQYCINSFVPWYDTVSLHLSWDFLCHH